MTRGGAAIFRFVVDTIWICMGLISSTMCEPGIASTCFLMCGHTLSAVDFRPSFHHVSDLVVKTSVSYKQHLNMYIYLHGLPHCGGISLPRHLYRRGDWPLEVKATPTAMSSPARSRIILPADMYLTKAGWVTTVDCNQRCRHVRDTGIDTRGRYWLYTAIYLNGTLHRQITLTFEIISLQVFGAEEAVWSRWEDWLSHGSNGSVYTVECCYSYQWAGDWRLDCVGCASWISRDSRSYAWQTLRTNAWACPESWASPHVVDWASSYR